MNHPTAVLLPEYASLMSVMRVLRTDEVNETADRLLKNVDESRYEVAHSVTGVPIVFMAASFEREASSDFTKSPAQGDPFDAVSKNVPRGRGPFRSWAEAAVDAYHLNGLDKVGTANWTWPLVCYYGELFNGFGPRDYHHIRTSYLWGGTNLQQPGKYVADGKFDAGCMDEQIGIVPMMMRMAQLRPNLALPGQWPFALGPASVPAIAPARTPMAAYDIFAIQRALKAKGFDPGDIDGSFGRSTSAALRAFEASMGYAADGLLDARTVGALVGNQLST